MLKISVIVPVYNVALYIRECLESIVNQSYSNIEIILVDDGSTDSSGLICDEYAQKDQRIMVIHKVNRGLVSARKEGILLATGEYVTYVDSDDWIDLDAFEKVVNRMGTNLPDIIACGYIKEYPHNPDKRPENLEDGIYAVEEVEKMSKSITLKENYFYNQIISGSIAGKFYKRSLIAESQMVINDTICIGEDIAVFNRCYIKSKSVMVYNLYAYHYRIRENSLMRSINNQDYFGFLEFVKCLKDGIRDRDFSEVPNRILYDIFYQLIVCYPKKALEKSKSELNLFPKIRKGDRVIVYGKGVFSKGLIEYISETGCVKLVGIIDSSDINYIFDMGEFDYVIISIANGKLVKEIENKLINMGIKKSKIVYIRNSDLQKEKLPDEVLNICEGYL